MLLDVKANTLFTTPRSAVGWSIRHNYRSTLYNPRIADKRRQIKKKHIA